jgi:hypothetical protein
VSIEDRKYFVITEGSQTYLDWKRHCEESATKRQTWNDWAAKYSADTVVCSDSWDGSIVHGLPAETKGLDPKLWRMVRPRRGCDFWTPRAVGKAAKAIKAEMKALGYAGWIAPGVDRGHISGLAIHYAAWEHRGGKLIVSVHRDAKADIPDSTTLKMSEYAAILEAEREAK